MLPHSGRKKWILHDGPRSTLRGLRSNLAKDGCADSQVVLAKQLLEEECELEADKVSNFKQALEWLICATEQGHQEARHLLRRCVRSDVMSEGSAAMVRARSCLAASRQETVARKAARDLFDSLSKGQDFITTAQLERRIREVSDTMKRHADEEDSLENDAATPDAGEVTSDGHALLGAGDQIATNGDLRERREADRDFETAIRANQEIQNLTVENLVSAAVEYCQGGLPLMSYDLTLTDPGIKALDHIPLLQQAFLHPIVFIKVLYLKLLYYLGTFSFRLSNLELMSFVIVYSFLGTDNLALVVPLALYYCSFVSMVICTFKMLHSKKQFVDYRKWSGLFLRYSDGNLQADESENLFVKNNLWPFVHFFIALFVNLFLYPFVSSQWILFSEFSVLSFLLMLITLFSFNSECFAPDLLRWLSFSFSILAKYPYENDTVVHQGWRFLDLHFQNYPSYVIGSSIEFCLNARILFSLMIPLVLFSMAKRDSWKGTYKYVIPHCVTLSWMQMFLTSSQGATMFGLMRGTLAVVCMLLFLPIVGIVSLLLPIFAFLQGITLSNILYTAAILVCFGLSLVVTCVLAKLESTKKYITPLQLLLAIVAFIYLGTQFIDHIHDEHSPGVLHLMDDKKSELRSYFKEFSDQYEATYQITWEDYYKQCNQQSWAETNMASTQIKCAILKGTTVDWEGQVKEVSIDKVDNKLESLCEYLPQFLKEIVVCYYGEEYMNLCHRGDSLLAVGECEFVHKVVKNTGKECHLNKYNKYSYKLRVYLDSGGLLKRRAEATVNLNHHFSNYTRLLRANDRVRFKGVLYNDEHMSLGSLYPEIEGYELSCVNCYSSAINGLIINSKMPSGSKFANVFNTIAKDVVVSVKNVLNFILNPVVVLK